MTEAVPLPIRQALMRWIGVPVTGEQDVGKATYASLDREALGSGGPSRSPAELSSQDMGVPSSQVCQCAQQRRDMMFSLCC